MTNLFLFLFILSLPLTLSCISSGKLPETSMKFEQTTVGNLGFSKDFQRIDYPQNIKLSFLNNFNFIDFDEKSNSLNKKDGSYIFAWFDLFGTIIFLIFLIYISYKQKKEAKDTDDANTTISDYTIY